MEKTWDNSVSFESRVSSVRDSQFSTQYQYILIISQTAYNIGGRYIYTLSAAVTNLLFLDDNVGSALQNHNMYHVEVNNKEINF